MVPVSFAMLPSEENISPRPCLSSFQKSSENQIFSSSCKRARYRDRPAVHPSRHEPATWLLCSLAAQTTSETVAKHITRQAGVEGSDLLMGGLTHTLIGAYWCPAGRSRVITTWEVCMCVVGVSVGNILSLFFMSPLPSILF